MRYAEHPIRGKLVAPYDPETDTMDMDAIVDALEGTEAQAFVDGPGYLRAFDFDNGELTVEVDIDEWWGQFNIPLSTSKGFTDEVAAMVDAFDLGTRASGYFAANDDIAEVLSVTPDGQGRVTIGKEYADEPVKVVVVRDD